MARSRYQTTYECGNCGAETERERLTVKKVEFREMGSRAKTVKSRVVAWLCPACLVKDPVWNMEPFSESPNVPVAPVAPVQPEAQMEIPYDAGWN